MNGEYSASLLAQPSWLSGVAGPLMLNNPLQSWECKAFRPSDSDKGRLNQPKHTCASPTYTVSGPRSQVLRGNASWLKSAIIKGLGKGIMGDLHGREAVKDSGFGCCAFCGYQCLVYSATRSRGIVVGVCQDAAVFQKCSQ